MSVHTVADTTLPGDVYIENNMDRSYAARNFSKTHTKSSSWPHNRLHQEQPNLRNSIPQRRHATRHERTLSDSYAPRRVVPIIPRPHSTPRHGSNLISAMPSSTASFGLKGSDTSMHKLGRELLPPTPNVAKEREKWRRSKTPSHGGRSVSFNETVVVISDSAEAKHNTLEVEKESFSMPQSPPPKHIPFRASLSPPPPSISVPPPFSSAQINPIKTYDDSQLALDFAEDIPSDETLLSKFLSKVGKRFM